MKSRHLFVPSLLLAAAAFAPSIASAGGGTDPAAAQALFNDARTLMKQNRWADACPKLEESERLDPGIGTSFNLASCYEHIGRTASAWAGYLATADEAKRSGETAREKVAREHAAHLEPKLSHLEVTLMNGADPNGLRIQRDGIEVGRGQWSTPLPIDPGEHRITASAPGKKTWEKAIHVPPDAKTVRIEVPALTDEPTAPPAPVVVTASPPPPAATAPATPAFAANGEAPQRALTPPPNEPDHATGDGQRAAGFVIGGLGIAGLGVGTAFGLLSKQKHDQSNSGHCDANNVCDPTGVELRHRAVQYGTVSTVGFVAGGVGVVGGLVLLLTAPHEERPHESAHAKATWQAAPTFAPGGGGMTVRGSF